MSNMKNRLEKHGENINRKFRKQLTYTNTSIWFANHRFKQWSPMETTNTLIDHMTHMTRQYTYVRHAQWTMICYHC